MASLCDSAGIVYYCVINMASLCDSAGIVYYCVINMASLCDWDGVADVQLLRSWFVIRYCVCYKRLTSMELFQSYI
ncbi:MAG: hypothetical protein HZB41_14165 [Ignavibacteriae bacterium]|nr:hypothetical protein [Ignavibacteriota bacterium]